MTRVLRTMIVFDGEGFPIARALSMTVHVNDSNDITIGTAFEVSNRGAARYQNDPDPEIVLRRTTTHSVTLKNGGTMVWMDLMQPEPEPERPSRVGFWSTIWAMLSRNPAARPAARPNGETVIFVTVSALPRSPAPAVLRQQ